MSEGRLVPLRNRKGEVVNHAIVSEEDFERVMEWKWHQSKVRDKTYAMNKINKKTWSLHHFIMGKPHAGMIIDHKNSNGLDNRRENIRFATSKQNGQNRIVKATETSTSPYIGVSKIQGIDKFEVSCGNYRLGRFEDEVQGALMYDVCAFIVYGEHAKTNGLIDYDVAIECKLEDILVKSVVRQDKLPACIYIRNYKGNIKYYASTQYGQNRYKSNYFKNVEDAVKALQGFKLEIQEIKTKELQEHYAQPIIRNDDGQAIIRVNDKKGDLKGHTIVDDHLWHELSLMKWAFNMDEYCASRDQGNDVLMHIYIYKKYMDGKIPTDHVIDHINRIRYDNRIINLRTNTSSGNGHNKTKVKGASSKYFGVYWSKKPQKWLASITKDYKQYHCGLFKDEKEAALAYNKRAIELYGDFANLNVF